MNTELQSLLGKKAEWLRIAKSPEGGGLLDQAIRVTEALGKDITEEKFYRSPRRHDERVTEWTREALSIRLFWKRSNWVYGADGMLVPNELRTVQITVSDHLVCNVQIGPQPDADRDDFWVPGAWEETLAEAAAEVRAAGDQAQAAGDAEEIERLKTLLLIGVQI